MVYACAEALESRRLLAGLSIAAENQLPGAPQSQWDISGAGDVTLQGFSTDISVNQGQTVSFKIDDKAQAAYHLDIYRMGYYQGNGARLVTSISSAQTQRVAQPAPLTDATTGLTDCGNWSVSASWQVPADATSGIYFAKAIRDDTGGSSHIFFIVRNDTGHSDVLFQTSDTTWQAYNDYGGNSLYVGNSTVAAGRGVKVSYNRPFHTRATTGGLGSNSWVFYTEYPMVRFLEKNGYDVSYFTGVDTDRLGSEILEHKVFATVGHDEYWSAQQRANVEAARAAGVNLAFFSGNISFWKTRWETSIDGSGTPYRTLVCYKESQANAKIDPSPVWTGSWRDPRFSPPADGGRPENALTGTLYTVDRGADDVGTPITVPGSFGNLRFWRNTSVATLTSGQTATLGNSVLGYEWDEDLDNGYRPAGEFDLSSTTQNVTEKLQDYGTTTAPGTATHSLTFYKSSSGALVFSTGTVQWSWGLDASHDGRITSPDVNLQQATVNVLADMHVQPATLMAGLVPASASTDAVGPTSTINTPAAGATVHTGANVIISGTASDGGGGVVAGVEVSVDGGLTWHKATGRNNWTYSWSPNSTGTAQIRSRATDDSGNIETPSAGRTVNVAGPISLWSSNTVPGTPSANDSNAVELGVKFRSDIDGFITSLEFYKGSGNTGTHVGHLWTAGGTLLGSATFSNETATGWQEVDFQTPVAISAGVTYVASYYAPAGHYAVNNNYFGTTGVDNQTLHVPTSAASGGNGVYVYGAGGGFPSNTFNASNYWVDVVFDAAPVDTVPPSVSAISPTDGALNVATNASVTATFSEEVDPTTINTNSFQLLGPGNVAVASSVTYNAATKTATLTPNSPLANSTLYTAVVHAGVKDLAGNILSSDFSWNLTTAASLGAGPFSLWNDSTVPLATSINDSSAVELGLKFRSDIDGFVTALRFYKGSGNTGTHVGHLWTLGGTLLATATFTGETAGGWQQVTLSSPVAITANTTYVVSYFAPVGHYAGNGSYFASGFDNAPLHAPSSGASGGNGLYLYGATGGFPVNSFNSTNYWVDVVVSTGVADNTPPTVASHAPATGATGVSPGTTVSATFSERVQAGTISFVLRDGSGNVVPSSVSYVDATRTATLTPNAALSATTTYTATVTGAKDLAGNTMSGSDVWSFTTGIITHTWSQTTAADFNAGTQSGTSVTGTAGGEVQMLPSFADDFAGTSLGAAWTTTSWAPFGGGPTNVTVSGGILSVGGAGVFSTTAVNSATIEGRVSFGNGAYEHFGLATDLSTVSGAYWAMFSTA
ncbi:MAG TPA: DUF4082 domain-containing protein, partial [Tepidisphaeraceae bacterium]